MARGIQGRALAPEDPSQLGTDELGSPVFALTRSFDSSDEFILSDAPFKFRIIAAICHCEATNASGTIGIERNGTNVFGGDITCDTNHEVTSIPGDLDGAGAVGLIDDAERTVNKGDTLEVSPTNSAKGTVTLLCVRSV